MHLLCPSVPFKPHSWARRSCNLNKTRNTNKTGEDVPSGERDMGVIDEVRGEGLLAKKGFMTVIGLTELK